VRSALPWPEDVVQWAVGGVSITVSVCTRTNRPAHGPGRWCVCRQVPPPLVASPAKQAVNRASRGYSTPAQASRRGTPAAHGKNGSEMGKKRPHGRLRRRARSRHSKQQARMTDNERTVMEIRRERGNRSYGAQCARRGGSNVNVTRVVGNPRCQRKRCSPPAPPRVAWCSAAVVVRVIAYARAMRGGAGATAE